MKLEKLLIKLPVYFNILIINKNYSNDIYIIIFNDNFFFKTFKKNDKGIFFDKKTNTIEILNNNIINKKNINNLNFFLKGLNYYFYNKIKFKGKGYKMRFYDAGKLINFYFGKSHNTIMMYRNIKLLILGKYKFMLLSSNNKNLIDVTKKTIKIKYINQYTLRGLRLSKQLILKRTGKKGSYV